MDTRPEKAEPEKKIDIPKGKMWVKVYAPFKDYFEGMAESISAENDTGPFDILPGHRKFLTLLTACNIDIQTGEGGETVEEIKIDRGVMFVQKDRVTVFLDV